MFDFGKARAKEDFERRAYFLAPKLYRLAYARLGNAQDAEDLVQDTFVKAFRAFKTFRQNANLEAWLVTILINTIRDHIRKANKLPAHLSHEDAEEIEIADISAGPEEQLESSELNEAILKALKSIPESMSMPLLLREIHDMTYKDIAEVLDVPIGTVMSRLSRARQLLKNILSTNSKTDSEPRNRSHDLKEDQK